MIRLENVLKKYDGYTALDGLNLEIPEGSIYGLLGVNGSGKTTIIRLMSGILRADAGTIEYDGESVWENEELKKKLALIPDELYFPAAVTMEDMGRFYRKMYPDWNECRFHDMVESFHLDPRKRIRNFSKGMKKQAAFCLAMSTMPKYLLLDEPIDGLDPIVRKKVWKYIIDDVADYSLSVLVSSHNLREMEGVCDRIGILSQTKMQVERDLDDLRGDLHKLQISFGKRVFEEDPYQNLNVLHKESWGSVDQLLVRGSVEEVTEAVKPYNPIIFDLLPLTLEEVFIYELGGESDEIRELLF